MPKGNVLRRLSPIGGVEWGRVAWLVLAGAGWLGLLALLGLSVLGVRAASWSDGTRSIAVHSGMP
jgi:hypothetical protein